jgi:hypothetical protein
MTVVSVGYPTHMPGEAVLEDITSFTKAWGSGPVSGSCADPDPADASEPGPGLDPAAVPADDPDPLDEPDVPHPNRARAAMAAIRVIMGPLFFRNSAGGSYGVAIVRQEK